METGCTRGLGIGPVFCCRHRRWTDRSDAAVLTTRRKGDKVRGPWGLAESPLRAESISSKVPTTSQDATVLVPLPSPCGSRRAVIPSWSGDREGSGDTLPWRCVVPWLTIMQLLTVRKTIGSHSASKRAIRDDACVAFTVHDNTHYARERQYMCEM